MSFSVCRSGAASSSGCDIEISEETCSSANTVPYELEVLSQQCELQPCHTSVVKNNRTRSKTEKVTYRCKVSSHLTETLRYSIPFLQTSVRSLLGSLCANYGYNIDIADLCVVFDNDFFQCHPSGRGYNLTDNFLSEINSLKYAVLDQIDKVLNCNKFDRFLYQVKRDGFDSPAETESDAALLSLNSSCACFAGSTYSARIEYVDFLRSEIVTSLMDIINRSSIVREGKELAMNYLDKDQFFIHVITTFERLFMLKVMCYWNRFCTINHGLLSLFPQINFSNPFILASCPDMIYAVSIPVVVCPVAFTHRHGLCISFVGIDNFDRIISECKAHCISILNPIVVNSINRIIDTNDRFRNLKSLSKFIYGKIDNIVLEKFFEIMRVHCMYRIASFFNELIVWPQDSLDKSGFLKLVEEAFTCVFNSVKKDLDNTANGMIEVGIVNFEKRHSMSGKCGFMLDRQFSKNLMNIRKKLFSNIRKVAIMEFNNIIRGGKWGDVGSLGWHGNRKELLAAVMKPAKQVIDAAYEEVSNLIQEARVVQYDTTERKIKYAESCILARNIILNTDGKIKDIIRLMWNRMTKEERLIVNSGEVFFASESGTNFVEANSASSVSIEDPDDSALPAETCSDFEPSEGQSSIHIVC
ncbi:hypothetical protein [Candidatus Ichthyocystis hellenicum]|uniref:hypothetical protein n=1 Tax=Candidatus Ichthyocystis hellenicum TaxID=1561003 RepID=UPI000B8602E1|nr:hypothetical protein [Candidatus Ichthyocystis hellenicum]